MVLAAQEEQDDQESQESHSIPLQYVILQPQAQQQVSDMADVQLLQHFAEGVPLLQQQGTDLQQPSPAEWQNMTVVNDYRWYFTFLFLT